MYKKKSLKSGALVALLLAVVFLSACTSQTNSDISEEEKKEIIEMEESTKRIDDSVEELDSAIQELNEIKDLLN